jgi:Cu+-exporting ATPase
VEAAQEKNLLLGEATDFDSPLGKGVLGTVEGKKLVIGSLHIMAEANVDVTELAAEAERLRGDGATVIFMGIDGKLGGLMAIADPIKKTTPAALAALREAGIRVVMLTGDNKTTALAFASRGGLVEDDQAMLPGNNAETLS